MRILIFLSFFSLVFANSTFAASDPVEKQVDDILLLNAVRGAEFLPLSLKTLQGIENCAYDVETPSNSMALPQYLVFPARTSKKKDNIRLLYGTLRAEGQKSFAYQVSHEKEIGGPIEVGVTYLNEGHIPNHHRDVIGAQLWSYWTSDNGQFKAGVGLGPQVYFDTTTANNPDGYIDDHGFGALASVSLQVQLLKNIFAETRYNRTLNTDSFDANSFMIGIGVRLSENERGAGVVSDDKNKIRVLSGASVVNSFHSEQATPIRIDIEREIKGPFGVIASYLSEGDAKVLKRQGAAIQARLSKSFYNDRLELSFAVGPYVSVDTAKGPSPYTGNTSASALITFSGEYWVTHHVGLNASFDRVQTTNNRDTDLFLFGPTLRF